MLSFKICFINLNIKNHDNDLDILDQVAIKTIKKSKIETEADLIRIRREIQIMSSVQHPNIIHIYEGGRIRRGRTNCG